jgi:hypothetical protein
MMTIMKLEAEMLVALLSTKLSPLMDLLLELKAAVLLG